MRSAQLRCALMQMSSDNVAHWRPSLSRRSSFCSFPCPRRCSYRATFPCDIHGEFASRANLRSCLGARRRARWISARSMFEPGVESFRCQNLHEPSLSPQHITASQAWMSHAQIICETEQPSIQFSLASQWKMRARFLAPTHLRQ